MKQSHWWLVTACIVGACHRPVDSQDLPSLTWHPVDSVIGYYLQKDGDHLFHSNDLLGLELVGGIDKKSHQFVASAPGDSAYTLLVTKLAENYLKRSLDGKVKKDAEGYIKADFGKLFPDQRVNITVYIKEDVAKGDVDTLERTIGKMPEISAQQYVSKDEAKKKFIADGNPDFTAGLDRNPLPASIELTVNEEYCTREALTALKQKLEASAPYTISEVILPNNIFPELRKVKTHDCVFHFKT